MKINEVCSIVGISKDNIRFYEKEGLITPSRDSGNNYREYNEEDILLLERIRLLRSIGLPIDEIHSIIRGKTDLGSAVSRRMVEIEEQKRELSAVKRVCTSIVADGSSFDELDAQAYIESEPSLKDLLKKISDKDTAEMDLTTHEFDAAVAKMLCGAYAAGAVMLIILGEIAGYEAAVLAESDQAWLMSRAFLAIYVAVSIVISVMSAWSSRVKTQFIAYIIAVLTLAPALWAIMMILGLDSDKGAAAFAVQILMVLTLYILRRRSRSFIEYIRYPLAVSLGYCIILTLIMHALIGSGWQMWILTALISVLLVIVAVCWTFNGSPRFRLTMFHAIVTASRMVAVGALFTSYHGQQSSWRRGTDEPDWFEGQK